MLKLALIGKNIKHSKSKLMYEKILNKNIEYTLIDVKNFNELPKLETLKKYDGVSITSPYKEFYLDQCETTHFAKELNAINCLFYEQDQFYATNTDYLALKKLIGGFDLSDKKILVLGSGPMARVSTKVLNELNLNFELISRKNLNFEKYKTHKFTELLFVINCLSRGVELPVLLEPKDTVWDLNYLNSEIISNDLSKPDYFDGESLLYSQAEFALSFWKIKDLLNS